MRPLKTSLSILVALFLLVGCSMPSRYVVTPIPTITPPAAPTEAATTSAVSDAPTPTATAGIFAPFEIQLLDAPVNLRINPGTLFDVYRLLPAQATVTVLGKAPGGEWLYVDTDDGSQGWVATALAVTAPDLRNVPTVIPDGIQIITGKVVDTQGQPVTGIGFAAAVGQGGDGADSTNGTTDETGTFYIFLPASAGAIWTVSYVSMACTSNRMDANCNCINNTCGQPTPERMTITLPDDQLITFTWLIP